MKISQIDSIELDRSKPFNHCVRIKDAMGNSIQVVPVKESAGWEQFSVIYKAWAEHPEFNATGKEPKWEK